MEKQLQYFETNYDLIQDIHTFQDGNKIYFGNASMKKCRYCGKDSSEVPFQKVAHAIPEFIGNKRVISNDECDICNEKFSMLLEDHFAKFLGAARTISQIKGKKGVPAYKTKKGTSRIDLAPDGLKVQERIDDKIFEIDKENHKLIIHAHKQPYIPVGVFKCLTKMAIAIMPDDELANFIGTIEWLLEPDHQISRFKFSPLVALYSFMPGPNPHRGIKLFLFRRKSDNTEVPYMVFVVAFSNYMFQIHVPSMTKDQILFGKEITLTFFPTPFDIDKPFGEIQRRHLDLSSPSVVSIEYSPITLQFERMIELDPSEIEALAE